MLQTNESRLLEILKYLKANENVIKEHAGICYNVRQQVVDDTEYFNLVKLLKRYYSSWKHFSGDFQYPVEGRPDKYTRQGDKWSRTAKYGRLRWQLLNFLIKELSKEV
jgi:hypothetical protein